MEALACEGGTAESMWVTLVMNGITFDLGHWNRPMSLLNLWCIIYQRF